MRRSPFRYEEIARELTHQRPYHQPTTSTARSAASTYPSPENNENNDEMDIMRMASRNVRSKSLTKRAANHFEEDTDETSSVESKRVKLVSRSLASRLASERPHDYQDKELFGDASSSESDESSSRQDASSDIKGNHYTLSKIVEYLQARTLASYFMNPTKEDRMKSSGLANVTKSLMAASVVHLGGKYDRHADSYLRGFRQGLSYASDRHEKQQEEGNKRGEGPPGVPKDLIDVYNQLRERGGKCERCRERKGSMRQQNGDMSCDAMGEARRSNVQLCTLAELKQLESLDRLFRSHKRPRWRRSATSASWKPKGVGNGRWRGRREMLSSSRSRRRRRGGYGPGDASKAAGSSRTRGGKPKGKRPKKKGGRSKRR